MCNLEGFIGSDPDDEQGADGGAKQVRMMSDGEILYFHDRLHHPSLRENKWIPLLEAEIKRRGLRQYS